MNAENTYEYTFTWFRKKLAIEETTRAFWLLAPPAHASALRTPHAMAAR